MYLVFLIYRIFMGTAFLTCFLGSTGSLLRFGWRFRFDAVRGFTGLELVIRRRDQMIQKPLHIPRAGPGDAN